MDVGTLFRIRQGEQFIGALCTDPPSPFGLRYPVRRVKVTLVGIIFQGNRTQYKRKRGRGRGGIGNWQLTEIGTQEIELKLCKLESCQGGHVRRMNDEHGSLVEGREVSIGLFIEQGFIEQFRHKMRAAEVGRPQPDPVTGRPEDPVSQFGLPILPKEAVFKIMKDLVAIQGIIAAGKRSSGQGMDQIEFIEQTLLFSFPDNLLVGEFSKRAKCES